MILLCAPHDLAEGQSRGFKAAGLNLFAVRREGRVYAYRNRCPHREIPLGYDAENFLDASGRLLQCGHHGALFLIETGECIQGPCLGEVLEALPCREDEQGIWLDENAQE
ncbi:MULTISPECIES: Rieske (2Fe-2S) protein [Pseudomonas nitroreducens/multiresinivorans group]|uniref:Rieske 2Fe-2S domain-containing protein n=1 Tax=Pseudomonas multiresinivorans TaxID=95301 RepID=A0A7Z3BIZ5_9PSED|nr:Rieske 2Fe-2S domain-containing protein [Pseudomonas multiresinivorans]QJP07737.1 Rieske 2Fe-2S domain-containing protein [Pseudomonas multiresinivorans]